MDENQKARYLRDIEYFSKRLEENPKSKVFMPLAMAYLKLEKFDEVIEICTKGLDNNPDYIAAKTILAQAFLGKGMLNEAKGLLLEVATFSRDNYRANKLLGEIYRAEENIEKAIYYYRTAYFSSPEDLELKNLIEELATTVDATPKGFDELKEDEPLLKDEPSNEDLFEAETDITDMTKTLAEDVMTDISRSEAEGIDIFEVEAEVDSLVSDSKYEEAIQVVKTKLGFNQEYMQKKIAEIEAYIKARESEEIVIPDKSEEILDDFEETEDSSNEVIEGLVDAKHNGLNEDLLPQVELSDEFTGEQKDVELELENFQEAESVLESFDIREDQKSLDDELLSEQENGEELVKEQEEAEFGTGNVEISQNMPHSDDIENETNILSDLDKTFESKLDNIDINPNKEAIDRLQGWLDNIARAKEKRNV
jgi:tetratricopeptide (TPR) repeat protein